MQLKKTSREILDHLMNICSQMTDDEFSRMLPLLMQNSVGKHVRHIIEFFDLTVKCSAIGELDYGDREHNKTLESSRSLSLKKLQEISDKIDGLDLKKSLNFKISYDLVGDDEVAMPSNLARELVYNIEHAVHHMAIIKVALLQEFPHIKTGKNFGIAYSTVKYLNKCAQ